MRSRGSSFPVAAAVAVLYAATVAGGCAHAPSSARTGTTPSPSPAAPRAADARPEWMQAAPAAKVVAIGARDERRCRRETPIGSRVERVVCRTAAEDRLREEAAAERVRWGTRPTF